MTDYVQEQEMEVEALQAILMDDFKELDSSKSGLRTENRCFQITLSPQDDDVDESTHTPVQLALIFSHTEKYPDELPHLNVKSLRGIKMEDLNILKEKLEQEASENLGMAMIYTLVTSAKEWLGENYGHNAQIEEPEDNDTDKDDIIVPHGEPVTIETFLPWRERFEAEVALERAKVDGEWRIGESGRRCPRQQAPVAEEQEEEGEEEEAAAECPRQQQATAIEKQEEEEGEEEEEAAERPRQQAAKAEEEEEEATECPRQQATTAGEEEEEATECPRQQATTAEEEEEEATECPRQQAATTEEQEEEEGEEEEGEEEEEAAEQQEQELQSGHHDQGASQAEMFRWSTVEEWFDLLQGLLSSMRDYIDQMQAEMRTGFQTIQGHIDSAIDEQRQFRNQMASDMATLMDMFQKHFRPPTDD